MKTRVECHAIYGLGGKLMGSGITALDKIMDDISPIWDCSLWYHSEAERLADGIIARQKRYKDKPIVIFICHSAGCLAAMQAAWRLNTAGIVAAYIGAIDPTALVWFWGGRMGPPMLASHNILKVDEIWAPSGPPASARRRDPTGSRGGRYIYPDGWQGQKKIITVQASHVGAASHPTTRATILKSVKEVLA